MRVVQSAEGEHSTSEPDPQAGSTHIYLWRPSPEEKAPEPEKQSFLGKEVGRGENWSHLSKRRQRARLKKVYKEFGIARPILLEMEEERRIQKEESQTESKTQDSTLHELQTPSGDWRRVFGL